MRTDLQDEEAKAAELEAKAAERMARLVGICPKCGDAGWWIDDSGLHFCDCKAGIKAQEEDEGGD